MQDSHLSQPWAPTVTGSGLVLFAVAVDHVLSDAGVLLHVLGDLLSHQLEDVLGRHALGLSHLHRQHVQAEHRAFGDGHLGHHRLPQLGGRRQDRGVWLLRLNVRFCPVYVSIYIL